MKKYYLTTPIYYVNAAPHIGHAYTTIAADAIRRLKRLQGYHAVLTTGTDEHGQKVERSARAAGKSPEEFTDIVSAEFRRQWQMLDLSVDRFMRTSDPRHHEKVKWLFQRCMDRGYIYRGAYTGQYCVSCELYVSNAKPNDPCPDCKRPTETVTEENYFFKLSAFQDKLLELYQRDPDFILPEVRRNEVISFVKQGLSDLSISRTTIQWGIPLPVEGKHVFYVWFDALTTYMSAVEGEGLWPADLHLIGKEILRFHAVYWPAFLMAADVPLPRRVFAHGWLLFEEDKMSKSRGNIVRAEPIQRVVGMDGLRYFLLREIVFGQDGSFSYDALIGRYNAELANGLGNLVSRTLTMIQQYLGGILPDGAGDAAIASLAGETIRAALAAFENLEFSRGLEAIWGLLSAVDKYIVQQAPWNIYKKQDADSQAKLRNSLYTAAEAIRVATVLLSPVLPDAARRIWAQLGIGGEVESFDISRLAWGELPVGRKIGPILPLFPRLDPKEAIPQMRALEAEVTLQQAAMLGKTPAAAPAEPPSEKIAIEDFAKVDMRVGLVLEAGKVKGSDKLLQLKVDIGEAEPRTLVAGIAEAYTPEQLLGRKVVIVANLQPRKLRGITSNGMIVAASLEGGQPVLTGFHEDVPVGARLK